MGGVPTEEEDLTALFDLIKTDFSCKKPLNKPKPLLNNQIIFLIFLFVHLGKFPIYFVANKVKVGLLEDTLIEELAKRNVHFMRPFGVSKTPESLRFAYVSGVEVGGNGNGDNISLTGEDLKYVEEQYMLSSEKDGDEGIIDVLFTWSWPQEVASSTVKVPSSAKLGPLMWHLKPRYIFAPSHDFMHHFERAPYENIDMKTGEFLHATRFIALSHAEEVKSETKTKWIYALNLTPAKFTPVLALAKKPDDCTSNPFLPVASKNTTPNVSNRNVTAPNYFFQVPGDFGSKRKFDSVDVSVSGSTQMKQPPPGYVCKKCHSGDHFFRDCIYKDSNLQPEAKSTYVCHICHEPGHNIRNCPKKDEEPRNNSTKVARIVAPETCWFCLSNPAARKHLIADIGEEVYLSLAKGPLTPEHVIIVPIEHVPSTLEALSESMQKEIESFMIKANYLHEGRQSIFFRMANNPSHHFHLQAISIDSARIVDFLEFLEDFSIKLGYNFKPSKSQGSFFEFSYISESKEIIKLAHYYDPSAFFPAQYGRQVLAAFLEIKGGSDWKNQIYNESDEKKFVSDIKKMLKPNN